ncbi:hypothetical protein SO802_000286 [Lithocarpus litseifolius]|uniref:chitinase n=1 Tax=Lithocarpus litseifolius TaxID=425828 RepID=A0AAW2DTW3_9ROSI
MKLVSLILLFFAFLLGTTAEQCGTQAGGAVCPNGLCCSQFGWRGNTNDYCGNGCQSQCSSGGSLTTPSPTTPSSGGGGDVSSLISATLFDQMLKYRNDPRCKSNGFYTYNAFIAAAQSFNGFGTTGDDTTRKRELAAFLALTSHETTGRWPSAPDGPYEWDIALLPKQTSKLIVHQQIGHVHNIMAEDLFSSLKQSSSNLEPTACMHMREELSMCLYFISHLIISSGHILLTCAILSIHRSSSRHIHDSGSGSGSGSDSPTSPQTSTPRS